MSPFYCQINQMRDMERIGAYSVGNIAGHGCDHNNASGDFLLFQDVREVLRGDKRANDTA